MARELRVTIVGDSSALQAALARANGATSGFAASMEKVGSRISKTGEKLTKGVTLPLIGLGALSTKAAVDFQNAMELLHTQAGIAQSSIAGLSKQVLSLAGPTATAPDELAAGLYHLSSQGLRGAQAMNVLKIAAEGAKMGQANLEDVTNALGAVIASGIPGVHSYGQAMGELNATVGAGDMRMQDLADAMGTGLPAKAAVAGVSLRDVAAALAVFGDNNIRGAAAGTLLNSTLRLMEGPSKAAAKAMSEINLNASDLGNTLRNKGLVAAVELLQSKLQGLSKADQFAALTHIFGGRQAGGVMLLIDQLGRLKSKEEEVAAGGANFAKDWTAYTKTAAYHLASMGAEMQASGVTIGNILLPVVSELTNKIASAAKAFDSLSDGAKKAILVIAGIAAALGPVLSIVGKIVTIVGALAGLSATAAIVLGIVVAVVALGAAFAAAIIWPQKFQQVLEKLGLSTQHAAAVVHVLQAAWEAMKAVFATVIAVLEAIWANFGSVILAQAVADWNLIKGVIEGALQIIRGVVDVFAGLLHGDWSRVWQGIQEITRGAWTVIKALTTFAMSTMRNVISLGWAAIKAVFHAAVTVIEGVVRAGFNLLRSIVTAAMSAVRGAVSAAWNAVKSIVHSAVNAVESAVRSGFGKLGGIVRAAAGAVRAGVNAIVGVFRGVIGVLHDIVGAAQAAAGAIESVVHAAGKVGGVLGKVGSIAGHLVPHFASGVQNFGGGLALVGEDGPELVRLPRGADVFDNFKTRGLLSKLTPAFGPAATGPLSYAPARAMSSAGATQRGEGPLFGEVHVHNEVDVEALARRVERLISFRVR